MARKKQEKQTIGFYGWTKPNFANVVKTNKNFTANFHGAMLYAHYEMSFANLKKEVIKYLKNLDAKHPFLDKIKDMDEFKLSTVGKYMYIINHGGDIPDNIIPSLLPALEKIIDEEEAKIAAKKKEADYLAKEAKTNKESSEGTKVVVSIQDRLRERAKEIAGEVEGWIDDMILDRKLPAKTVDDFVSLFKANELKGPHMKFMKQAFERRAEFASMVAETKDKDILEGYSGYSKSDLKKIASFYQNLLSATDMLQEAAKVVRAPRKKKPVSQEKLVAKLKYKKEDTELGLVSLNPIQILGAKEVWVYNTKTRKLAQYKTLDERGLLVKGTSIDNFSSESKEKTLRKPVETLAEFKKASKIKLRTFLKDLTTVDVIAPGKLNENHIILRIDK